ncbi:reverse transcriptase RNA-dependent DNA polymerase [Nitzschia inconspicua]|uniref:Reverse transcriptase RNA-dependent DNA polymerase n=1 Tax=Nitzschia inconspicua TaxID=303405 RepID=A0A9K3PV60_9STRA|nr:reverse transcriptase RNA-dependent DNA polymerase [Nitzschia inconspicua]
MGISPSPDIAQEIMEKVLHDLFGEVKVYIDDIGCFSTSWDKHMSLLDIVLSRLKDAGFTFNPLKCEWGVKETDFLGHWLTPDGHKPWKKKSQLAPLTSLLGTKVFNWGPEQQKSFQEMKAIVARDALLAYPDNSIPFDIEADASDYQLGAVIKQKGRPIAYYSRKLNSAQHNYTTIKKKNYCRLLKPSASIATFCWAGKYKYIDHKNLTHEMAKFSTQRVLRWRLLFIGATYHYARSLKFYCGCAKPCPVFDPRVGGTTNKQTNKNEMKYKCI